MYHTKSFGILVAVTSFVGLLLLQRPQWSHGITNKAFQYCINSMIVLKREIKFPEVILTKSEKKPEKPIYTV